MVASVSEEHKGKKLSKIVSKIHIGTKIDTCSNHNRNKSGIV